ncbi:MAG: homoserine O-succinyltransferase [Xanthobacteraceae bacterium]|nr:homoserine O-succinyltransferase [Xanthobacteraceae bacterium]
MPLLLDTARSDATADSAPGDELAIGLVNNMPDAAFDATERQFLDLIAAATPDLAVRFKLFSIPEMPRTSATREQLAARYRDVAELWDTRLDGLIVTGTEPRAAKLADEPYWPAMAKLVDWARDNTASTIWSCLAAHAAVLHADGIERRPLAEKLFGVFDYETVADHPLTAGVTRPCVPHSRFNDLPATALAASGYRLLSRSATAGVDAFAREERGGSLFVFFQGHPEYDTNSLAREYRRDVGRYLRGERVHYPAAPQGYLSAEAAALAEVFRIRAIGPRRPDLIADFPMAAIEAGLDSSWRRFAVGVYRNWIDDLQRRKSNRRTPAEPARRAPRDAFQDSRRGGARSRAGISSAG